MAQGDIPRPGRPGLSLPRQHENEERSRYRFRRASDGVYRWHLGRASAVRDDQGQIIDYGDYIEQLTYLLFLKMADERAIELPKDCDWPTLYKQTGTGLIDPYIDVLRKLGKRPGLLGDIFAGAQSRFNNPVNLKRMLTLINETEWMALDVDVKAQAFEGLREKAASEGKKGAGQYFTPRVLIKSTVRLHET